MSFPGFITVRTGSSRLPKKCLLPFGDMTVLEHIITRAKYYNIEPIVCTTTEKEDIIIENISRNNNVKIFRGNLHNKLKRWLDCCDYFDIEKFHTVDADDPFFDGYLMRKSFNTLSDKYDMIIPTVFSANGGASVGFSLTKNILERVYATLSPNQDTEMVWYYLEKIPNIRIGTLKGHKKQHQKIRLTLDYEEDYWLLRTIERMFGHTVEREEIDKLFKRNPDLAKINWFRNDEWKNKQLQKKLK
jgi:spore coat polysaccharide biosynthesis protein SpsF (cytidylyltransferase family)